MRWPLRPPQGSSYKWSVCAVSIVAHTKYRSWSNITLYANTALLQKLHLCGQKCKSIAFARLWATCSYIYVLDLGIYFTKYAALPNKEHKPYWHAGAKNNGYRLLTISNLFFDRSLTEKPKRPGSLSFITFWWSAKTLPTSYMLNIWVRLPLTNPNPLSCLFLIRISEYICHLLTIRGILY